MHYGASEHDHKVKNIKKRYDMVLYGNCNYIPICCKCAHKWSCALFLFFFAQKVCNAIEWSLPFTAGKQERKLKNKQKPIFFFNKSKNRSSLDLMHAH